jgi:hypothetical protein
MFGFVNRTPAIPAESLLLVFDKDTILIKEI